MLKKLTMLLVAVCAIVLLAGCSHNVVTYSDGVGFETTMRPDTGNFGLTFRYGKILTATVRENSEVDMKGDSNSGAGNATTATVGASGSVKVKVGKQITGYYVDALKAGATAEQLEKYTGEAKKE